MIQLTTPEILRSLPHFFRVIIYLALFNFLLNSFLNSTVAFFRAAKGYINGSVAELSLSSLGLKYVERVYFKEALSVLSLILGTLLFIALSYSYLDGRLPILIPIISFIIYIAILKFLKNSKLGTILLRILHFILFSISIISIKLVCRIVDLFVGKNEK